MQVKCLRHWTNHKFNRTHASALATNCVLVVTKAGNDGLMEDAVCCLMTDIMEIQPNADDSDATLDNAEMT